MYLHKIHYDHVIFNKILPSKYLNKLFWSVASRIGKNMYIFSAVSGNQNYLWTMG